MGKMEQNLEAFRINSNVQGQELRIHIVGNLDALTSPKLLELYQETAAKQKITRVEMDLADLGYVSSAGLRAMLIMYKGCPDGLLLKNLSEPVTQLMNMTGFGGIFEIE